MPKNKPILYLAQNRQIFKAAQQLGLGLEELRDMAGALNLGIRSLSKLSLDQRQELIERLASLGGQIRNPAVTDYDRAEERRKIPRSAAPALPPLSKGADQREAAGGGIFRGRLILFPALSPKQRKLIDDLASKVQWREPDGFARLCHKHIKAAYPRNNREVTKIRLALQSLIRQQEDKKDVGADPRVRP